MKSTEKIYRGTITGKEISYLGDLKHYTISFATGDIHVFTKDAIGVMKGNTIEFTCTYHANKYIASNIKLIRTNTKKFVSKYSKSTQELMSI